MGKIITEKDLASLQDIEKDILTHPEDDLDYAEKLFNRPEFSDAEINSLKGIFNKIVSNPNLSESQKLDLLNNEWKLNFKQKPPTPQEFLEPKWLGTAGEEMYDYKKEIFFKYFDPTNDYRHLILSLPIGWGKSTFSLALLLYVATHYYLMRNPHKYLGVQKSSYIVTAIIAFSQDKAHEIITQPLKDVIQGSDRFVKCRTTELLEKHMLEGDPNKIYWTTAGEASVIRIGDLRFKQISDVGNLLGLSILNATATELSFFIEKGWSNARVMRLYNDVRGRMFSRFEENYYKRSILDSSPDSLDNDIDRWIIEESAKDKTNYLIRGTKWEYQPWLFKEWNEDNSKTFPVYKGTASSPPKILSEYERDKYDDTMIIDFPIDIKGLAVNDLTKTLKDYAGEPSNARDKLIQNHQLIESIFVDSLINEYEFIHAPASMPPETLIWDMIKDKYFLKVGDTYQFYRHPSAIRYLSVDQSEVNDWTGIAMTHVEINTQGELVFVTDFAITIIPTQKERINLEAIKFFVHCLKKYGHIRIGKVSFDSFQSSSSIQYLDRMGIKVEKLSVDTSTEPYLEYISKMNRGVVKMGKSLIMKNNLKSLILGETKIAKKKKVDHVTGEMDIVEDRTWETSKLGYYGKDLSDAVVASVYLADKNGSKSPQIIWKDLGETSEEIHDNLKTEMKEDIKKKLLMSKANRFVRV